MGKACRRPKLTKAAVSGVEAFVNKKKECREHDYIAKCHEYLEANPGEAESCYESLVAGVFKGYHTQTAPPPIPDSRTHIHLLSNRLLSSFMVALNPALDGPLLKLAVKHDPKVLLKLFLFGTAERENTPVFTHDPERFISYYQKVHTRLDHRLKNIVINQDGRVEWATSGFFQIIDADSGIAKFRHSDGEEVSIPGCSVYHHNPATWSIANNFDEDLAECTNGTDCIKVKGLFKYNGKAAIFEHGTQALKDDFQPEDFQVVAVLPLAEQDTASLQSLEDQPGTDPLTPVKSQDLDYSWLCTASSPSRGSSSNINKPIGAIGLLQWDDA